jgi:hypothetical protein
VTNLGSTRIRKITVEVIVRIEVTAKAEAIVRAGKMLIIGKIRGTKEPCSTRYTTR